MKLKKICFAFALLMTAITANADSLKRTGTYLATRDQYHIYHGKYDVVMFGDSLTERGKWQDMFPDLRIGNRGISGDDTMGMLQRVSDIEDTGAKLVFIMAGTNDVSEKINPDDSARNLIKIAELLRNKGIRVILQSTLLGNKVRVEKNEKIKEINKLIKDWSHENGFQFLDLNEKLSSEGYLSDGLTIDGIHLNANGYSIWKGIINPYLYR